MKSRLPLSPLFVCLCIFVAQSLLQPSAHAESPARKYTIGAILALSGQVSGMGSYVRRGLELSYEQLPPEQREKIALVFEDDQFDPRLTVSAYRKLVGSHNIDAVLVMASPPANALVPITEREGKLLIGIGASDPNIAVGRELSFVHWVIPSVLGATLADELIRRDYKRIAFVISEGSGTVADANAVISSLKQKNRADRVVFNEQFRKDESDFRSTITKLKQLDPEAVILVLFPGSLSTFAKQFKTSGLRGELIGMETFEDEGEIKAAAGALTGTWYVNAAQPTGEFVAAYKTRFGEHPGWAASNAFDTLKLLSDAIVSAGTENKMVSSYLQSVKNFRGASGVYSASGDNRFTLPAAIKRVSETGFEPLDVVDLQDESVKR